MPLVWKVGFSCFYPKFCLWKYFIMKPSWSQMFFRIAPALALIAPIPALIASIPALITTILTSFYTTQCPVGFNSKLLPLPFPTLLFKIPCPHTCFNHNYPFRTSTYPFSQKIPPFFSISFIFNPFSPFVFPLPITWFNPLLNQAFCFQITSLFDAKALFFPPLK